MCASVLTGLLVLLPACCQPAASLAAGETGHLLLQALAILDGKAVPSQASGKVTLPTADRERRWEASEEAARLQRAQQQDGYGMTFRTPQPWRSAPIRQPAGSAVVLTQSRDVMTLDIPARGLTGVRTGVLKPVSHLSHTCLSHTCLRCPLMPAGVPDAPDRATGPVVWL